MLSHSLMLRASAEATDTPLDPRFVTDRTIDPLIPGGVALLDFVDAVLGDGPVEFSRRAVIELLGEEGLVDAAGVVANFEMMNRIADGTGMPVGGGSLASTEKFRVLTGIDRFHH